jgi:hypothetical protein
MTKNTYIIPVTWSVCADMHIEAESLTEAIKIADDAPLPDSPEYSDGSFEIITDLIGDININNPNIQRELHDYYNKLEV